MLALDIVRFLLLMFAVSSICVGLIFAAFLGIGRNPRQEYELEERERDARAAGLPSAEELTEHAYRVARQAGLEVDVPPRPDR
jgi:hypothetical protein